MRVAVSYAHYPVRRDDVDGGEIEGSKSSQPTGETCCHQKPVIGSKSLEQFWRAPCKKSYVRILSQLRGGFSFGVQVNPRLMYHKT